MANKKIYFIISLVFICILMSSMFVSASWFGDLWGKIMGKSNVQQDVLFSPGSVEMNSQSALQANNLFSSDGNYRLTINKPVYSLSVDVDIKLDNDNSYARVIMVDNSNKEYLVYEASPMISDNKSFSVNNLCEETCYLDAITPILLRIEIEGATLKINNVNFNSDLQKLSTAAKTKGIKSQAIVAKSNQDASKIVKINQYNKKNNLRWTAGETSISKMTYAQKRVVLSGINGDSGKLPNLQGFEYYVGGIFEFKSSTDNALEHGSLSEKADSLIGLKSITTSGKLDSASSVVDYSSNLYPSSWDWSNRNGENWITSIKNQGSCGSCWTFAVNGAVEAVTNLYYNQHLNLNQSEQDLISCSGAWDGNGTNNCRHGGWPNLALDNYTNQGIANETCFPYVEGGTSTDKNVGVCSDKCSNWQGGKVNIAGRENFGGNEEGYGSDENWLKEKIITKGPLSGGMKVGDWGHAMVLVGWETDSYDGKTIWIFKNSWGADWGDCGTVPGCIQKGTGGGYALIKIPISLIRYTYALLTPVTLANNPNVQINCSDKDWDGYCNWGISNTKPSTCPASCSTHAEKDCDDSNQNLGPFYSNYECKPNSSPYVMLMKPANATLILKNAPVSFNCDAGSNTNLANVTLYVWNSSGSLFYKNTTKVSGIKNSSTWMFSSMPLGEYMWNCLASDTSSKSNLAVSNRTFVVKEFYCGMEISQNTKLTDDLDCPPSSNGMIISADNVTLDCSGHSLIGKGGGYGIYTNNLLNVTIKNCVITNFTSGIEFDYSKNNKLINNSLFNNDRYNFYVWGDTMDEYNHSIDISNKVGGKSLYYYFNIRNQVIKNLDSGHLELAYCNNITLMNNIVRNGDGIKLDRTNNSIIINNNASNNDYGIFFDGYNYNNNLINNLVLNNSASINPNYGSYGADLYFSSNNSLVNNTFSNNAHLNIYLHGSDDNLLIGNVILNSSWIGIAFVASDNNLVSNNVVLNNKEGIRLERSANNSIINNNILRNSAHGVWFMTSDLDKNNNLSSNLICLNSYDIYDEDSNKGSNNTCTNLFNWNDAGTNGCTHKCAPTICSCSTCTECQNMLNLGCSEVHLTTR